LAELRNQSRAVVALIVKANAARDKRAYLLALREALDELLISVRIAKEAKAFKSQASSMATAGSPRGCTGTGTPSSD